MSIGENKSPETNQTSLRLSRLHPFFNWFTLKQNIVVCLISAVVLTLHLIMISRPAVWVFDEDFYIPAARSFLSGSGLLNSQHAPLGKIFIALGIFIFGNNSVGWRIFSILFGVASIFLFYLIVVRLCRQEAGEEKDNYAEVSSHFKKQSWFSFSVFVPVFATFLFAFENMSFVMAHFAMLDVFYVTFMLLGFLFYLRGNYWLCGAAMGLSMLCKVMASMAVLALLCYWAFTRRHEIVRELRQLLNALKGKKDLFPYHALWDMTGMLVASAVVWFALLPLLEFPAARQFYNPVSRTIICSAIISGLPSFADASPLSSRPWSWSHPPYQHHLLAEFSDFCFWAFCITAQFRQSAVLCCR